MVIMDVKDYINVAHCQLKKQDLDTELNKDPTRTNARLVNNTIQRFKEEKLLKEKIADSLKVSNLKTPKFYMQPKIHKKNNPGQPVVNYHLQPIIKDIYLMFQTPKIF